MHTPSSYLFRCPSCRTRNRIPAANAGQPGKCGKCGSVLKTSELFVPQPIMITDANFEEKIIRSPIPALIDCWAPWCSACSMISPVVAELAGEYKGRFRIGKLNVDTNPLVSSRYDTRSIPTLLFFENGQLKDTLVGAMPKPEIVRNMQNYL
jgi:thioredoxin 2